MPSQPGDMAVGLFDLLGFKTLIAEHEHRLVELRDKVSAAMAKAVIDLRHYYGSGELGRAMFSDTLFLWIPATAEYGGTDCVERMCLIASHMLSVFLEARMPVRGAISFGECLAAIETRQDSQTLLQPATILLGMPVIEAYELERAQEWSGVALCQSAGVYIEKSTRWPETGGPSSATPYLSSSQGKEVVKRPRTSQSGIGRIRTSMM